MAYKEVVKIVEQTKILMPKLAAMEKGYVLKAVLLHRRLKSNGLKHNALELARLIEKAKKVMPRQDW